MKRKIISLALGAVVLCSSIIYGAATLMPPPVPQFFDSNGDPCVGCKVYFYENETTTPKDTYTDGSGLTANANPIVLNARGESSTGIYFSGIYTVVLKTPLDVQIWSRDGITGLADATVSVTMSRWSDSGLTPTYLSGTSFSTVGDNRSVLEAGRRVKTVNGGGTYYGRIVSSTFGSGTTTTTVTLDTGSLDSSISIVYVGLETPTDTAIALDAIGSGSTSKTFTMAGTMNNTGSLVNTGTFTSGGGIYTSGANTIGGTTTFTGTTSVTGSITFVSSPTFTASTPMVVNSTTKVGNLNSDLLDGYSTTTGTAATSIPVLDGSGQLAWQAQPSIKGAFAYQDSFTMAYTTTTVTWGGEDYDTDSIVSSATGSSRIVIPDGYNMVTISAMVTMPVFTYGGNKIAILRRNGGDYAYGKSGTTAGRICRTGHTYYTDAWTANGDSLNLHCPNIPVNAGDYFELYLINQNSGSLGISGCYANIAVKLIRY